jgi:drug/metabolite transporter (DMT)-like permease
MKAIHASWLGIPILNTLYQIFTKQGTEQIDATLGWTAWATAAIGSPLIWAAIGVEILCFFLWIQVLSDLDLSEAFPLTGISYVLTVASGWFIFREPIAALQVVGSALILAGVYLIATGGKRSDDTRFSDKHDKAA